MKMKLATKLTLLTTFFSLTFVGLTQAKEGAKAPAKPEAKKDELADIKHPLQPMLWKVEGKDLKKPSYLFGSMHVSDKRVTTLNPIAEAAYQDADTLATEVKMDMMSQMASMRLMMRKGSTLKDDIGEEMFAQLEEVLAEADAPLNAQSMNAMKTWAVLIMVSMLEEMSKGKDPLDLVLWNRAGKDKKGQWALETAKEQMGGFDALTKDEQNAMLKATLDELQSEDEEGQNAAKAQMKLMTDLYLKGEEEGLLKVSNEQMENDKVDKKIMDKFMKIIMDDRNKRMADTIERKLKAEPGKSHFMVAGTLHYVGEGNVGKLLEKKGYKVTRMHSTD